MRWQRSLALLTMLTWPLSALAAGGTFYIVVFPDGTREAVLESPVDQTYPIGGQRAKYINVSKGERNEGVPISAEEFAQRQRRPYIITATVVVPDMDELTKARIAANQAEKDQWEARASRFLDASMTAGKWGLTRATERFEREFEYSMSKANSVGGGAR